MDTKDIQVNTIIAGAFIFFSLSIGAPNSTASYTQVVLDHVNTFKEVTVKVFDNFIKTEIESDVFEALLQVIAIVFGFRIVSIMFSMDSIVPRSEDTLRLARQTDTRFKKILDRLDQMDSGENAEVIEKETTKTAIDLSEKLSLYSKRLKEYFKNRRERTKKRFRNICVCYIVGIILAVTVWYCLHLVLEFL